MIYIHSSKIQIIETLIRVIHIIKIKYKDKVIFVRFDDERALESE